MMMQFVMQINSLKDYGEDLEKDDPIFIIHADHGGGLGEHGFYRHPLPLYEELIHISCNL